MTQIFHIVHLASAAWAAAGELITAGAILWSLNTLATAVHWTYRAGRFTGRLWFTYGLPALLWLADGISWCIAQVNWLEVRAVVGVMLRTIASLLIAAALTTRDTLSRWHSAYVGSIEWGAPAAPVAPHVQPLALVADELSSLSCNQIRSSFGLRQRCSKQLLIAAAVAA